MSITDLSADGLAKLEAQLLADLEMVRRVRALVVSYADRTAPVAASPAGLPAEPAPEPPNVRTYDPIKSVVQAVQAMPASGFHLADLNQELLKRGVYLDKLVVKLGVRRLVSQGKVEVAQLGTGRRGSLYKSRLAPGSV